MALLGTALLLGAGAEREASETRAGQSLPQRVQGMWMLGMQKLCVSFLLGQKLLSAPRKAAVDTHRLTWKTLGKPLYIFSLFCYCCSEFKSNYAYGNSPGQKALFLLAEGDLLWHQVSSAEPAEL